MHFWRLRFEKIKLDHPFCYGDTHFYQKKLWSKCQCAESLSYQLKKEDFYIERNPGQKKGPH